jgi:carboxypeptidase Q
MSRRPCLASVIALACLTAFPAIAATDNAPLSANSLATAARIRDAAMAGAATDGSRAYDIVESLTTEIGERLAGTPPAEQAVEWAKAKFKAFGYDKVYTEPVTFEMWTRGHEDASVVSPYPQHLAITALGHSIGTSGPLAGDVVEFASLDALKAAKPGTLDGKIAYISFRMQRTKDGSGYGPAVMARVAGPSIAGKLGAKALLIRSIGTDHERMPHTGILEYSADAPKIPAAALSNSDADLLSNMIRRGAPVRVKIELGGEMHGTVTSYNVIGEITGRTRPDEVVTIGGHLDSWDLGTGAIDDGAGVAITMAAGALLHQLHIRPDRTVRVIAYMDEEAGSFGGKAYADAHLPQLKKNQLGAESDFGAARIYALHAGVKDSAWPVIEQIGQVLAPLGIVTERNAADADAGPDTGEFAAKGMAWAQLAQDGTDYFDWHHTANDTLDKIDPKALDQQVAAYAVLAYLAAEARDSMGSGEMPLPKPEQ